MAKHLFERLTDPDPDRRYSADEASRHPWITGDISQPLPATIKEQEDTVRANTFLKNLMKSLALINFIRETRESDRRRCHSPIPTSSQHIKIHDIGFKAGSDSDSIGPSPTKFKLISRQQREKVIELAHDKRKDGVAKQTRQNTPQVRSLVYQVARHSETHPSLELLPAHPCCDSSDWITQDTKLHDAGSDKNTVDSGKRDDHQSKIGIAIGFKSKENSNTLLHASVKSRFAGLTSITALLEAEVTKRGSKPQGRKQPVIVDRQSQFPGLENKQPNIIGTNLSIFPSGPLPSKYDPAENSIGGRSKRGSTSSFSLPAIRQSRK